ncbi:MAG: DUF454 family protein [Aquificaceae bacterium]
MKRQTFRFLGFCFFFLGTVGVFIPLMPTVPLYLLAIIFLSRSSKRDVVCLKKLPFLGKRIYPYIKKSVKYLRKWNTPQQSSST